jgi:L-ascorbate peroxidase
MKLSLFSLVALTILVSPITSFIQKSAFSHTRPLTMTLSSQKEALEGAQQMVDGIINEKNCGPVFVRLAWHDSGPHDASVTGDWPAAGGAIGSIRFEPEIKHGANAGLAGAVKLLEPVKEKFPEVSYADIFQMGSARSIELAGGPKIDMKYGRVDASGPEQCSPEGMIYTSVDVLSFFKLSLTYTVPLFACTRKSTGCRGWSQR